ncbi:MAG TPA: hypothetical protein VGJ22_02700 [Anaerolineales bacterium]|jgi:hypothetical protein
MNDLYLEKMAESRRKAIKDEMSQISLGRLAGQADGRGRGSSVLFKLGSGLVALGGLLRKRRAARPIDYWAVKSELTTDHR